VRWAYQGVYALPPAKPGCCRTRWITSADQRQRLLAPRVFSYQGHIKPVYSEKRHLTAIPLLFYCDQRALLVRQEMVVLKNNYFSAVMKKPNLKLSSSFKKIFKIQKPCLHFSLLFYLRT
jgi:hypothetical protein